MRGTKFVCACVHEAGNSRFLVLTISPLLCEALLVPAYTHRCDLCVCTLPTLCLSTRVLFNICALYICALCMVCALYGCTVRMCVCTYVRMCVCVYVRMCVCVYMRMCVCAYVRM